MTTVVSLVTEAAEPGVKASTIPWAVVVAVLLAMTVVVSLFTVVVTSMATAWQRHYWCSIASKNEVIVIKS